MDIDWDLINWEPDVKKAYLISVQYEGWDKNRWQTHYAPAESDEDALQEAYSMKGVVNARVKYVGQTWVDLESELSGSKYGVWAGD